MSIHSPTTPTKKFASSLTISSPPTSQFYPNCIRGNQPPELYLNLGAEISTQLSPTTKTMKKKIVNPNLNQNGSYRKRK